MKIVVVGGGIVGATAAYYLARAGAQTVLVDAAHEGRATDAGAGIVNPWTSRSPEDPHWFDLANAGARDYPDLVSMLAKDGEADTGYRRVGALLVSADPAELDAAEPGVRAQAAKVSGAGPINRLSPDAVRSLFPPLRHGLAAIHVAGGARVDGRKLARALRRAAARHGASERTGSAELVVADGQVHGIKCDGETVSADAVIVAAGAWTQAVLAPIGANLAVEPQRGQIVHLQLPGIDTSLWPVVLPFSSSHYLLAFEASRVVVGATRESDAGFDYRATAAGLAEVLNQALSMAPGLASATVLETRIGFRPMSPGTRPVLGRVPGVAGLLIGTGMGASGLTLGPAAGKLLAQAALGQATDLDLRPYERLQA